jgi:hypothetical protein
MSDENKQLKKKESAADLELKKALFDSDFSGYEGVTSDMLNTPFLKIAQSNTPACDEENAAHIAGLKPGMFYNSQTGKVFGKEVLVIPIFAKSSFLHYGKDLGQFKAEYVPEDVPELESKGVLITAKGRPGYTDKDGGKCFQAITFFCFLPMHPEEGIVLYVAKSKTLKHAKNWNSRSMGEVIKVGKETKKAARFHIIWKLKTVKDENEQGSWYNIGTKGSTMIERVGTIFDEDYSIIQRDLMSAVELVKTMRDKAINYSEASKDDEIVDDEKNQFEDD